MKGLVGWALTGVLVTVLGTGSVLGYQVLVKGWLLVNVGPSGLIFCLIFGAVGGVFIGLIQRWTFGDRRYIEPAVTSDRGEDADTKIKRVRQVRARDYMDARKCDRSVVKNALEPPVENIITACDGQLTYRVMAYRRSERP